MQFAPGSTDIFSGSQSFVVYKIPLWVSCQDQLNQPPRPGIKSYNNQILSVPATPPSKGGETFS